VLRTHPFPIIRAKEIEFWNPNNCNNDNEKLNDGIDSNLVVEFVKIGNLEKLKKVLAIQGVANNKDQHGTPLIMVALEYGNISVVDELLKNGADINAQDEDGNTALLVAISNGHLHKAKYLLQNGADATIKNNNSEDAIQLAHKEKLDELFENFSRVA
jgi:ankyrin repeat protein